MSEKGEYNNEATEIGQTWNDNQANCKSRYLKHC